MHLALLQSPCFTALETVQHVVCGVKVLIKSTLGLGCAGASERLLRKPLCVLVSCRGVMTDSATHQWRPLSHPSKETVI